MSVGAPPSNAKPAAAVQVVRAADGETLRQIARRIFSDERAAELLAQANPGHKPDDKLPPGATIRVPDKAAVQKWATQKGVVLGLDLAKGTGTKQKRAWKAFQTGPTLKVTPSQLGPEAVLQAVLVSPGPGVQGPGVLTAALLNDSAALEKAISERVQWLGIERVLSAAAQVDGEVVIKRATEAAAALKSPDAVDALCAAFYRPLVDIFAMEALKEARKLVARAQQALSVTATGDPGGTHLIAALTEADAEARIRLLTVLAVPKANATSASAALDKLASVKAGLMAASLKTGPERAKALAQLGLPRDRIDKIAAALHPPVSPSSAEEIALQALGLDVIAQKAAEGAGAMHTLVQKAVTAFKAQVSAPTALAHLPAARASLYRQRGLTLDPDAFPPTETEGGRVLERALMSLGDDVAGRAAKLPEVLRVAWRAVETLGPNLAEVDASALGRGVGCLLARVATPAASAAPSSNAIRSMRPGDLLAMSGAAAARAQTGVDISRSLVPMAAALAAISRFPFVEQPPAPGARLELRRRLSEGFRSAYGQPPGLPMTPPRADQVRATLLSLVEYAALQTTVQADAALRARKVREFLENEANLTPLISVLGPARYKFRRDEMSQDGKWLCVVAALMDRTRDISDRAGVCSSLHAMLNEEGGRVLDATERALLQKLG
ncbi:MAG: hypothetical protein AB2A00_28835 [Myxococcota bacterium]